MSNILFFTILPTVQLCSLMAHLIPADVSASNTILTFEGGTIGIISDSGRCVCVLLYVYLRTSAIVGVNMSVHAAYQYSVHTCSMSIHGSTYYIMLIYIYIHVYPWWPKLWLLECYSWTRSLLDIQGALIRPPVAGPVFPVVLDLRSIG